jgi:ribosomal protein S18 acetylase RimI-like enzyme
MEIRRATVSEAGIVAQLNREVQQLHAGALPHLFKPPSGDAFSPDAFARLVADDETHILIGWLGDTPVGYVYAEFARRPENAFRHALDLCYVQQISVDRPYHKRGYGEQLIKAVVELARARGVARIELDVWAFNQNARGFFARQGFAVYNERMYLDGMENGEWRM